MPDCTPERSPDRTSNVIHIITRAVLDPVTGASPRPGECLACFLHRMLAGRPCVGTFVWTDHYRVSRARRAVSLVDRLRSRGAACDCSVVDVVWWPSPRARGSGPGETGHLTSTGPVAVPSLCGGEQTRPSQACDNWAARRDLAL